MEEIQTCINIGIHYYSNPKVMAFEEEIEKKNEINLNLKYFCNFLNFILMFKTSKFLESTCM